MRLSYCWVLLWHITSSALVISFWCLVVVVMMAPSNWCCQVVLKTEFLLENDKLKCQKSQQNMWLAMGHCSKIWA